MSCLTVSCAAVLATPQVAWAEDPLTALDGSITDSVGAVDGRQDEVRDAIDALYEQHRISLYVVYVADFSGMRPDNWADGTAQLTRLRPSDVLLAVATNDRGHAISVDPNYPITNSELQDVDRIAVEPALESNDWSGAAIGAADGLAAIRAQRSVPVPAITPGDPDPAAADDNRGGLVWLWISLGVVGVSAAVAWLVQRRRSSSSSIEDVERAPLSELDTKAAALIVETDNVIATNEQQLGFVEAQRGVEATEPFRETLAMARAELDTSLALRAELADVSHADDVSRRAILAEIVQRLEAADARLAHEAPAFVKVSGVAENAPVVLASVRSDIQELIHRLAQTRSELQNLSGRYSASVLDMVSGNCAEAAARLDFATAAGTDAEIKLEAGHRDGAAQQLEAARLVTAQAERLIDAIDSRRADLELAEVETKRALSEIEDCINEAATDEGRVDPFAALRELREPDDALSQALSGDLGANGHAQSAATSLDNAVLIAQSEITVVSDYIITRRGAVGAHARVVLAEARRTLDAARGLGDPDVDAAIAGANLAAELAERASALAASDVDGFQAHGVDAGVVGGVVSGQYETELAAVARGGIVGGQPSRCEWRLRR